MAELASENSTGPAASVHVPARQEMRCRRKGRQRSNEVGDSSSSWDEIVLKPMGWAGTSATAEAATRAAMHSRFVKRKHGKSLVQTGDCLLVARVLAAAFARCGCRRALRCPSRLAGLGQAETCNPIGRIWVCQGCQILNVTRTAIPATRDHSGRIDRMDFPGCDRTSWVVGTFQPNPIRMPRPFAIGEC